ncbi:MULTISPECIES: glycosyltransferase [Arthrospira]|uniref:Glycosyl transferase n=2 Tax=Limnospira platensis TaxID=118562 RepID=A0A5M3T0I8_LIMPL|nr:glycosyltransferase [Arthrospira platensis]KDR55587.1 glycosyl transferase family 1 [Arthrospira platensis str. Paraca]MBD2668673.1 glycosyltransferase [Arthrospira platensis FACHB-439]MBD2710104.1 glycosyltransferase [Arthrospira platensis FACHB-835]MDF2209718.1 glycosyltransferase [Arthrospira platensis NCB002]MDT9182978.1 glycosyltransferase [Limnospira sp. PMC 289.06]MDT9295081.1 glycosyltransferase [Arthrospira platensis PCC 7345]MDT9309410.1 glycosyltransferase [Limnospira sp. Parac
MRILSIHNNYQIRGGEDESAQAEANLLKENGNQVDIYQDSNDRVATLNQTNLALTTIWSTEAYQIVKQKLRTHPTDIVHVQNFFPLISPSVYYAAKSEGVPVVQTLRNYRLICPNGLFFRDDRICEDCLGKFVPYPGVIHACYRQNRAASGVTATMLTLHRMARTWVNQVDIFITLSQFARQKFIQAGWSEDQIIVKPNFVYPDPGVGNGEGGYALFVGRLSVEKGLDVLIDAWQNLRQPVPLKIVGDGPLVPRVQAAAEKLPHIQWLGRRPLPEVYKLMGEAMVLIFPSKWYETFGRVAVEAFAKGTPVIASNLGAIAELVEHGRTGLLFKPGDPISLTEQVDSLISHPKKLPQMRREARAEFEAKYTAPQNYQQLKSIYQLVLSKS